MRFVVREHITHKVLLGELGGDGEKVTGKKVIGGDVGNEGVTSRTGSNGGRATEVDTQIA